MENEHNDANDRTKTPESSDPSGEEKPTSAADQGPETIKSEASQEASDKASGEDKPLEDGQDTDNSMENLMDLYEESFKRFAEGEVVTGRIISVDNAGKAVRRANNGTVPFRFLFNFSLELFVFT